MKHTLQICSILILATITISFNACKKDGATGPQGPAGKDGSANVITANFTMSTWSYVAPYYYENLSIPELTYQNIDSALVMVYFSTIDSHWSALPYTQYNTPSDYYMGFTSSVGNVQVTWVYDNSLSTGSDPDTYYGTTVKCKVVVIPPTLRRINPHVHYNNYPEVKATFNLAD